MKYLLAFVALLAASPAIAQTIPLPNGSHKDDCKAKCMKQQDQDCHDRCKGQEDETGCYYDCMEPADEVCDHSCKTPKDQSPPVNRN